MLTGAYELSSGNSEGGKAGIDSLLTKLLSPPLENCFILAGC